MTKIFVTRKIPGSGLSMLKKRKSLKIDIYEHDKKIPRRELLKRVKGVDIILSLLTEKIDAQVMDAAGDQLKMVANYAVGFNNIDIEAAKERGIRVANTPSPVVSESVAEHAIALMFALAHRVVEADDFTRAGKYKGWDPNLLVGTDLKGKTIGVIGAGRIGSGIAQRLHDGFGVKIIYADPNRNPKFEKAFKAKHRTMMQLLKESDFVTLHVPLLKATHHLISTKELKAMKKTAFLINTSRGPVIDELALTKALEKGEIGGAGLDVYECEPLIDCNPRDHHSLRKMPNVIMTPHTASATIEARDAMSISAAKNILAFLDKKRLPNKVV